MAGCLHCAGAISDGAGVLLSPRHAAALWRRRRSSGHCPSRLRFSESRFPSTWLGVVASAAPVAASFRAEDGMVAEWAGWNLAFTDVLCAGLRWYLSTGSDVVAF